MQHETELTGYKDRKPPLQAQYQVQLNSLNPGQVVVPDSGIQGCNTVININIDSNTWNRQSLRDNNNFQEEQNNKQLANVINASKQHMLFDDKKILELENHIRDFETKRQKKVVKAFSMPSPNSFGEIIMSEEGLRGKYEVLHGKDLWGLFFYKVLVADALCQIREEFRENKRRRAEEGVAAKKKKTSNVDNYVETKSEPMPTLESFEVVDEENLKLTHLWWKPVTNVNLKGSVWEKIGSENSEFDTDALLSEFDKKKNKKKKKKKGEKSSKNPGQKSNSLNKLKRRNSNSEDVASLLGMKRSIEMGIAFSKLKWTFENVRTRLGDNEAFEIMTPDHHLHTNGLTKEKVEMIQKLLPSEKEYAMLRSKKPKKGMPLFSLRLIDELPDLHNRLKSITYWYSFRDMAMNLERSAYYLLKAVEVLDESNAFKTTLRILRTIGNFLNIGSLEIGSQYGT